MAIYFCNAAVFDIISSVMANFLINNLFFSNILSPLNFTLKALYLRELNKNKYIRWGVVLVIVIFVSINIINSFFLDRFKEINTIGMIINRSFFTLFTVWNLTLMFKNKNFAGKLRQNPDFWLTATMFCFAFWGLISTIITDVSYEAKSDLVLYVVFISDNIINALLFYGYFKGVKLLR